MQAPRSSSASDLQKSDPQPDSVFTRSFPSPFTAPIQAARKYLERQRNDGLKADADGMSRERDRRLERSLYEGHSIEAGLSFDGAAAGEANDAADHAYLVEGDGSEPLFAYSAAGPLPNSEEVRGAIGRLARTWEPLRSVEQTATRDKTLTAEEETRASSAESAARSDGDDAPPLAFGDVARRVWSSGFGELAGGTRKAYEPKAAVPPIDLAPAAQQEFRDTSEDAAGERRDSETSARLAIASVARAETGVKGRNEFEYETRNEIRSEVSEPSRLPAVGATGPSAPETAAAVASSPALLPQRKPECIAEDEAALAHDACNLLSALGLYSELLGSPGALADPYRHYAGDLKLLAGRSQTLISRLLLLIAATGKEAASGSGSGSGSGAGARATAGAGMAAQPGRPVETVHAGGAEIDPGDPSRTASPVDLRIDGGTDRTSNEVQATSLADLMLRWGSLLSTLAHGTLEVVLGRQAATPVPASAEALERILVNLVRNARAATVAGGAIRIGIGLADASAPASAPAEEFDQVDGPASDAAARAFGLRRPGAGRLQTMVLTVDDSGCGMTEEQIRRVMRQDGELDGHQSAAAGKLADTSAGTNAGRERSDIGLKPATLEGFGRWQGDVSDIRNCDGRNANRRSSDFSASASVNPAFTDTDGFRDGASREGSLEPGARPGEDRRHGLGLQVVRGLVASSGGTISIQSWPGRGTRIEIRWPVATLSGETSARGAGRQLREELPQGAAAAASEPAATPSLSAAIETTRIEKTLEIEKNSGNRNHKGSRNKRGLEKTTEIEKTEAAGTVEGVVGPDGFSEMELRAMMLRLHRTGPHAGSQNGLQERSPLSRRLNHRPAAMADSGRGFGLVGPGVAALALRDAGQNNATHDGSAKGAIAC